jgi:hypothetical protein
VAGNNIKYFPLSKVVVNFSQSAKMDFMKKKPLIFTILSILFLIEPAIKVLYFKASTQFDFLVIFANIKARNTFMEVVDFWLIFPIAGILITRLRKWTYFAFLAVLSYINYNIFTYEKYTWPYNSDSPFMYNYVIAMMSVIVTAYFLMPKVREPFFNRNVRWWENKARYNVQIACKLQSNSLTFPGQILNISQSGAFIEDSKYMKVGDSLQLDFNFLGQTITIPVQVMNKHSVGTVTGYGVKFNFVSFRQSIVVTKVIKVLKKSQTEFKDSKSTRLAA